MSGSSKTQERVVTVLFRFADLCADEEAVAEYASSYLDDMLDEMLDDDLFGTEGQNDPRGDFRDRSNWSCAKRVQGVDD